MYHIAYGCYEDFFYSRGVKKPSAIATQQFIDDFESYSLCDDHGYQEIADYDSISLFPSKVYHD